MNILGKTKKKKLRGYIPNAEGAAKSNGGEGGIRTPDTLSGMPVFKTGAINHSATSPRIATVYQRFRSNPPGSLRRHALPRIQSAASMESTMASTHLPNAKSGMVLSEICTVAMDSFRLNKVRFALTAFGMVIGTASLILVVTIGLTGKNYVLSQIEAIGVNMITAEYGGGANGTVSAVQQDYLTID